MHTLNFYTCPHSRGRIVRWMLEELGQPYEEHRVTTGITDPDAPYLRINPMGKVPALVHGDNRVTETAAICLYLADAFPEAGLAPPLHQRGAYYRWLLFAAGPMEAAITNRMLGVTVPEAMTRSVGYGSFEQVMATLAQALTDQDYIAGDAFSAADLYLGAQIGLGLQFGTIETQPAFAAYWQRLSARPAWQRTLALEAAMT